MLYLPKLQLLHFGPGSFWSTKSLSFISIIVVYLNIIDLEKLDSVFLGYESFVETTSIQLKSKSSIIYTLLDVPFDKGSYSLANNNYIYHVNWYSDNKTFSQINPYSITSDSSNNYSIPVRNSFRISKEYNFDYTS